MVKRITLIPLALAAASGMAALAHELLWTRRLIDLLGASGSSAARVFACFFLGLAIGSAWVGTQVQRWNRPWRAAAIAELMVAALALPALLLPTWTGWLWPVLGHEVLTSHVGGFIKLLVAAAVVLPPAFAMGVFLPTLVAASVREGGSLGREGIWLYSANTLGGVLGLAAACLVWLPGLGATRTQLVVMGLNVLIASTLFEIDRRSTRPRKRVKQRRPVQESAQAQKLIPERGREAASPTSRIAHHLIPYGIAFFSGLLVLAAEVVCLQMIMLAAPLTFHAPAAILSLVLVMLGISAMGTPSLLRGVSDPVKLIVIASSCAGLLAVFSPLFFIALTAFLGDLVQGSGLMGFYYRLAALVTLSLGPMFLIAGVLFPATLAFPASQLETDGPRRLGLLLACNGLGGFVGAELVYSVMMPAFGVYLTLACLGLGYCFLALSVAFSARWAGPSMARKMRFGALACISVALPVILLLVRPLPHLNPYLPYRLLDESYGREGVVAVIEGETTGRSLLLSNQYVLGGTGVRWEQERQGHLPLLLHGEPRQVAFIGLATGITPGAALEHEAVEKITAAEISPLVAEAAGAWFEAFNHGVVRDRRVRVVVEDGRTYLASCESEFDVVIGDLFLPWGPGEGRLFTVEHFEGVKRSLRPGGLFCQWLPAFQLTPEQLRWIMAGFKDAFGEFHLILNGLEVDRPVLGLIGGAEGWHLDWKVVESRCEQVRSRGLVRDPMVRHAEGVGLLYLGQWRSSFGRDVPRNTLGNLLLELDAGRRRLTGNPGRQYLHSLRWLQWLDENLRENLDPRQAGPGDESESRQLFALREALLNEDIRRRSLSRAGNQPLAPLAPRLSALFPEPLLTDDEADWTRWPGLKPTRP